MSPSALAKGYMLGTLVVAAAIEMVVPIILGGWLDRKYQTAPLFVLLGVGLGLLIMVTQLMKIVKKVK